MNQGFAAMKGASIDAPKWHSWRRYSDGLEVPQ